MRHAIVSVHNKAKLASLSQFLYCHNYNLLCSGGTYSYLSEKVPKIQYQKQLHKIEDEIKYPHMLNGRVKTLHPFVYGGLLADTSNGQHMKDIREHRIPKIQIAVVNLYPFEQTLEQTTEKKALIEQIDIGGHAMIRAAAKNYKDNIVLTSPRQYEHFMAHFDTYFKYENYREKLAMQAFQYITDYDIAIANYFSQLDDNKKMYVSYTQTNKCKYGTNPHQTPAALWKVRETEHKKPQLPFELLAGHLSYINVLDAVNSWNLVSELGQETGKICAASFKHTSPAGVSIARDLQKDEIPLCMCTARELTSDSTKAYMLARNVDPKSSFGDFIAIYGHVDEVLAKRIRNEVSDGIIALTYSLEAMDILQRKKNGRFVILRGNPISFSPQLEIRHFGSYALSQINNTKRTTKELVLDGVKTTNRLSDDNVLDLIVANVSLKYAQSNSVALAKNGTLLGIGCGQQSRIDCVKLACEKAFINYLRRQPQCLQLLDYFKPNLKRQQKINAITQYVENDFTASQYEEWCRLLHTIPLPYNGKNYDIRVFKDMKGISLASDGFFPFLDNIDWAHKYGVQYIIQPGGSIQDTDIIERCNEHKIAMTLSGIRHFFH